VKPILILVLALVCTFGVASAQNYEKLFITVKLNQGENPLLSGTIINQKQEPIEGADVYITTEFGTAKTKSNPDGAFVYDLPSQPVGGKFNVGVKAQKEGFLTGNTNTSFFVTGKTESQNQNLGPTFKVMTTDKIKEDPIAFKILQNIEESKQQEAKRLQRLQEINERQKFLDEQRQIANQNLLNDLGMWFEQLDPFNPRNAFSSFVSQMDATVQTIYWAQFNFTEAKTKEGLAALQAVLDSGGTAQEARKAFYEKAATPRDELLKVNNEFNANYVVTNSTQKSE
jgi:hypothetical protein